MGIYNHLDIAITDYVGENDNGESADPVLHDKIVKECTEHIRGQRKFNKMSQDAQYCYQVWEEEMKDVPLGY